MNHSTQISLWCRYSTLPLVDSKASESIVWHSVSENMAYFLQGLRWNVGNDLEVKFWKGKRRKKKQSPSLIWIVSLLIMSIKREGGGPKICAVPQEVSLEILATTFADVRSGPDKLV